MPPRVLDVSNNNVRLRNSKGQQGSHVALSYCWGSPAGPKCTTTTLNLSSRLLDIPFGELPLTIADAVKITRQLGKQFLWVDALCIIQGDKDDWSEHADMMGRIYALVYLTIAATGASDTTEGLFVSRIEIYPSVKLPYMTWRGKRGTFQVQLCPERFGSRVDASPLNRRAWVLQEKSVSYLVALCILQKAASISNARVMFQFLKMVTCGGTRSRRPFFLVQKRLCQIS